MFEFTLLRYFQEFIHFNHLEHCLTFHEHSVHVSGGGRNELLQDVPLWRGSYFELKVIETLQVQEKLLPVP